MRSEKSDFRRIAFSGRDLHYIGEEGMEGTNPIWGRRNGMPIQDLFACQAKHDKRQEEKAIVRAVIRYFETAPPRNAAGGAVESSIVNALHRYFEGKK